MKNQVQLPITFNGLSMRSKSRILLLISFLLIFICQNIFAQTELTIAGISVEGNVFSHSETIIALSGLRVGDKITIPADDKLQVAIKNLWKRKQFEDVQIGVERTTPSGVFLVIKVKELPRLNKLIIEGNDEIKEKDIVLAAGKVRGDVVSQYDLYLIRKNVKSLYAKEGLAFAEVQTKLEKSDTSDRFYDLYIVIDEGQDFRIQSIKFIGNKELSQSDLKGAFDKTLEKVWWKFWRSAKFNFEDYKKDKELLKKFFRKEGFLDADIIRDTVVFSEEKKGIFIEIEIYEGNRYYLRDVTFVGNTIQSSEALKRRLEFEKGDVYNDEKFMMNLQGNQESTDALSLYMDNGYLQARMEPKIKKVARDSVDVEIVVFEGDRYKIGRVEIIGNDKTKDKVIRRELYTRPGDYFDRSAIIRSVRALGVMNYFNPEALRPDVQPSAVDATSVDIIYKVEERSTDTFNAAIGFAGSYGLTLSAGITLNNFSITEPLQGGGGQIFNFNAEIGQITRYRNLSLGFTEPWLFDEPTTVGFNIFDSYYNYYYNIRRTGLAINFGRRFKWPDDYFRGDWGLRIQKNDIQTESSYYYRPGKYTEVTISQRISRISLNNLFFPTVGSKFSFSTDFAMGAIGIGATDFLKNELNYDTYLPLVSIGGNDRVVLYLGSKLGYVSGLKTDTTLSPIELYLMGGNGLSGFGVTPLRGYEDNSIGISTGSKVLAKYTAELRFALSLNPMPIYIYGFAEAGNVWKELRKIDPFDLKRAAGVGIQMFINPIGIFGFSYGYGFDPVTGGTSPSGWRFLFHLGQ